MDQYQIANYGYFCPTSHPIMVDPTGKHCWIDIPKCASSFVQKVLSDHGWISYTDPYIIQGFCKADSVKKFCVLRDPAERWISGFAQTYSDYPDVLEILDKPGFWNVILKNPHFDDHTEAMWKFLKHCTRDDPAKSNLEYIYLISEKSADWFYKDLAGYLNNIGYPSDYFRHWKDPINPYNNQDGKKAIYLKLKYMYKHRKDFRENINSVLHYDYHLLNQYKRYKSDKSTN